MILRGRRTPNAQGAKRLPVRAPFSRLQMVAITRRGNLTIGIGCTLLYDVRAGEILRPYFATRVAPGSSMMELFPGVIDSAACELITPELVPSLESAGIFTSSRMRIDTFTR